MENKVIEEFLATGAVPLIKEHVQEQKALDEIARMQELLAKANGGV
jgi:hypothetical protein